MNRKRTYGDAIAHSLGLGLDASVTLATRSLPKSQIGISRLSVGRGQLGMTATIPPEDTFIVAIYLTEVKRHELLSRGRPFLTQGYAPYSMRIVNLVNEFSAYITCPHETLVFYIPRASLNEFTDDSGLRRIASLACVPGTTDPVLKHLALSLQSAFERPSEINQLFLDYMALAICAHLSEAFGESKACAPVIKGGLTTRQAERAKEFMAAHCDKDVSLLDVAKECGLSRGYFAKAFKTSTGMSPHQWRLNYRIDKAKVMLLETSSSIAEIAAICGFADQSHLTRVFAQLVGDSPANWRRQRCS